MTPERRQQFLNTLTEIELQVLLYEWRVWARDKQLPPEGEWYVWLLRSGRGFGKTWTGANWIIENAMYHPDYPVALVGQTKADVRDTMVELGEASILNLSPPWFIPDYQPSKRRLVWPNGAVAILYSGDEPNQLRGPQHAKAWVDELAKFKYPRETWDNLELGLRLGDNPQVCVTTTPRPIEIIKGLLNDPQTVDVVGSTYENIKNLPDKYLQRIVKRYEGTRLGRQELYGQILDDVPGALWTRELLTDAVVHERPEMRRVVVSVDPAITSGEESNETGVIVSGLGTDGYGYVLDDRSLHGTPDQWARVAVDLYHLFEADVILIEDNQGGEMVEYTVKTVDTRVNVKRVRAKRGKYLRAEPVAALYEQHRVKHYGVFPELEDQMCTWVPGEDSPDRLDALVQAMTALMLTAPARVEMAPNPFYP